MNGTERVVLVTGALGALGAAVVGTFAAEGWTVCALDLGQGEAAGAALTLGGVDLTKPEPAAAAVAAATDRFGRLDALVNVAGGFRWETLADGALGTWDAMHAINLQTALHATKAALPHLRASGRGAVVNVGAEGALRAAAGMGAYAASKAAVAKLTEALAEEERGRVRVNAVLPRIIDTPANRAAMSDADPAAWTRPETLAEVMVFLASEKARGVTGALVPVTSPG